MYNSQNLFLRQETEPANAVSQDKTVLWALCCFPLQIS